MSAGAGPRTRRAGVSQSLARRQERRFARFQQKVARTGATPDELVAAAALYVRGVLTDLPPQAAERLAQQAVRALREAAGRFLAEGSPR